VAPRTPFFDLPPWGVALCLLAAACLIGVAVLPGLYTDLARNETAGGEPLQAPLPGREGETQLSYDPGLERMTVACFPGPATTALTLAVARQPNPNEPPISLYGPVTFADLEEVPALQYHYDIAETHILTVTTIGAAGGASNRYRVTVPGPIPGSPLEVERC
jgi:hypothetical protein